MMDKKRLSRCTLPDFCHSLTNRQVIKNNRRRKAPANATIVEKQHTPTLSVPGRNSEYNVYRKSKITCTKRARVQELCRVYSYCRPCTVARRSSFSFHARMPFPTWPTDSDSHDFVTKLHSNTRKPHVHSHRRSISMPVIQSQTTQIQDREISVSSYQSSKPPTYTDYE